MAPISPMLAKAGQLPSDQSEYAFEIKWDGIRAIFYGEKNSYQIMSRNLKDLTRQYPELAALNQEVADKYKSITLDGEIVAFGTDGLPSFSRLQHRMGLSSDKQISKVMQTTSVHYIIFDILALNGESLLNKSYRERREILDSLVLDGSCWQTPAYKTGDGQTILTASRKLGLEGIIAKRLDSPYQAGKRTGAWLKIKNQHRQELIIGGWVAGQGVRLGKIGALLLGYYDETPETAQAKGLTQRLLYAGKVGTGFTQATLTQLDKLLSPLSTTLCPFSIDPQVKGAHFVKPIIVGEFEFTEWTPNNTLRHPSFKGLRNDKDPRQVIRES